MKMKKYYPLLMAGLILSGCGQQAPKTEESQSVEAGMPTVISENLEIDDPVEHMDMNRPKKFPAFSAVDQDGNPYTAMELEKNDATVINLWFTGCSACIEEMDELNHLADELHQEEGVEFLSMCTDVNYDEDTKAAFDRIIADKKPTYKALAVDYVGETQQFLETIFAYPTTLVVDKNGKIIGNPIEGALTNDEQIAKLKANIEEAKKSSQASK